MENITILFKAGKLYLAVSLTFIVLTYIGLKMLKRLIKVLTRIDNKLGAINGKSNKANRETKKEDN